MSTLPTPPQLPDHPETVSFRLVLRLNMLLPGLGHILMGRPVRGTLFSVSFLGCFVGILVMFFRGYLQYFELSSSAHLVEGGSEVVINPFPLAWMLGALIVALILLFTSFIGLRRSSRALSGTGET